MPLIGYTRVSRGEQPLEPQRMELRAAGCVVIHEEHASGADQTRPALARLLATIRPGETLKARRSHFRSLGDPIDTTTPQGTFSLQVMGAVAELERALIRERTKAGLRSAHAQGRVGGNPALRAGNREALRQLRAARDEGYFRKLAAGAETWLPLARRHRPAIS